MAIGPSVMVCVVQIHLEGHSAIHRVISTMEAAVMTRSVTQGPKSVQPFAARTQCSADTVQVSYSLNTIFDMCVKSCIIIIIT